jgi:hypothetical protein
VDAEVALMSKRTDLVAQQLHELTADLEGLWIAATRDPKKEARRERVWMIFSGALAGIATLAARRALAKVWPILTGEEPLVAHPRAARPVQHEPEVAEQQPAAVEERVPTAASSVEG